MAKYTRYDIIKPIFGHPVSTLNDIPRSLETISYNVASGRFCPSFSALEIKDRSFPIFSASWDRIYARTYGHSVFAISFLFPLTMSGNSGYYSLDRYLAVPDHQDWNPPAYS